MTDGGAALTGGEPGDPGDEVILDQVGSWDVEAQARDAVADGRDAVADSRDDVAAARDELADRRDVIADGRDRMADGRDEAAEVRDDGAETRDQVADGRDRDNVIGGGEAVVGTTSVDSLDHTAPDGDAERVRGSALLGRERAEGDRLRAEVARGDASSERGLAASDRGNAFVARDEALAGRGNAAGDRHQAGLARLDELERRLTWSVVLAMLASVPDAIIAVDSDGTIVYINDQGETLFGWSRIDLLGQSVDVLVPDRFVAQHPAVRTAYFAHPTTRPMAAGLQLSARRRDGSEFPAEISLSASDAGPERWVLAAVRDVTKSRQSERDLEAARLEAVGANAAKDEFLSRISHELRTPLNAILGFGQLLGMEELDAGQVECVTQIMGAGNHLLNLVDEVLDISQVAQGAVRLSLEAVSVREVVGEVTNMIRPLADRHDIRVTHTPAPDINLIADRQRIKQVLTNLVANAVKYNRDGGSVRIDSTVVADERCRVTVTDTGLGISADDLEGLFTPFTRLSSAPADVEGSGLGLALAKLLVEAMHGDIGVSSHVGFGSSFWIELPGITAQQAPAPEPVSTREDSVSHDQTLKTVLYIEDNPSNIRLLELALTRRPDVRLIVAMEGRSGLDLAFEHRPDLVLLDLGLPDMSGEDVLRRLRADIRTSATPVIVISADAMPHRPAELLALGATGYMSKPLDIARLLSLIDNSSEWAAEPRT